MDIKNINYKVRGIDTMSTKKYKFSSTDRDPTFLYTRSPFTYLNDKIKAQKKLQKIEKEMDKVYFKIK